MGGCWNNRLCRFITPLDLLEIVSSIDNQLGELTKIGELTRRPTRWLTKHLTSWVVRTE
jgi:hypothetical protein